MVPTFTLKEFLNVDYQLLMQCFKACQEGCTILKEMIITLMTTERVVNAFTYRRHCGMVEKIQQPRYSASEISLIL
jgi:hypothetical protein